MSLQYYAQGIYLCAKCGAVLGFCGGHKQEDGHLVVTMEVQYEPELPAVSADNAHHAAAAERA